jgi:hypothetical protein
LAIVEQYPFLAEFLFENLVLGPQVFDHFLLLSVDPTSKYEKIQLPRLKDEFHEQCVSSEGTGPNLHHHLSAAIGQPETAELHSLCVMVFASSGTLFRLGRNCGHIGSAEIWENLHS